MPVPWNTAAIRVKRYDWALAPVVVVDCRAIFLLQSCSYELLLPFLLNRTTRSLWFYLAGTSSGAPLSFTKKNRNSLGMLGKLFDGGMFLALREADNQTVDEHDRLVEGRPANMVFTHLDVLEPDRHAAVEDERARR